MSYQELLSQALVKGLGVTLGVVVGLVTVTPVLKFLYTERPSRVQAEKKTQSLNKPKDVKQSNQISQTNLEVLGLPDGNNDYKSLFDDLQTSTTNTTYY